MMGGKFNLTKVPIALAKLDLDWLAVTEYDTKSHYWIII